MYIVECVSDRLFGVVRYGIRFTDRLIAAGYWLENS